MKLIPFADDAASISLGKLTIENGLDRLALYGSLDITRDQKGLDLARQLRLLLDQAVAALEREHALPAAVEAPAPTRTVRNPFA
ncbi:MAG: hypothetical protein ACRYG8_03595 [Janthinobacterium lividum]